MEDIRAGLPSPTVVHLFVNDYIPDETSVIGDFTEATFPGYSPAPATWPTPAFLNMDGQAEIDAINASTFSSTGTSIQTAYGYFVDDGSLTTCLWAERFSSPVPFMLSGSFVSVLLVLTAVSAFSG
jgi:hypothetical protein